MSVSVSEKPIPGPFDTDTTIFGVRKTDIDTENNPFWYRYFDTDTDTVTDTGYFGVSGKSNSQYHFKKFHMLII
jgi:hypothetical protein